MDETVNQGTTTQENAEGTQDAQKTFTQEEMNRIIADRVQRERSKYNDYDTLKEKAAKFDAQEEASKTELQKAILAFAQSNGCSEVRDGREVRMTSRRTTAEAQTRIHEMAYFWYNIRNCQQAEAICYAMEKMHALNREYLTIEEWEDIVNTVKHNYSDMKWEEGGYGDFEQFNFISE